MPDHTPATENPWQQLRQLTPARIALGRAGTSLPTHAQLDFQFAHAQARDAVHLPFDHAGLREQLHALGHSTLLLHSAASDRHTYLQRPDLGRRLDEASAAVLHDHVKQHGGGHDLAIVIADGLSSLAVSRHSLPFLQRLLEQVTAEGWSLAPITLIEQGRVAVADEVGELLGARMVAMVVGERPGLSSPDSVGIYLTHAPRVGRTDAERNCISNVRPAGQDPVTAARRLAWLVHESLRLGLTGVGLKDHSGVPMVTATPSQGLSG